MFLAFEHLFNGDSAVLGDDGGRTHFVQGCDSGLDEVVGVGRTLALCKDVGDAHALEDGTHGATGLHARTVRCRLEDDAGTAELGNLFVGDGALVDGDADKVLLGGFNALCDGSLNFVGLAQAPAYDTVFIADDDDSGESECTATLGNLGDTVDGHKAILEFEVTGRFYSVVSLCHSYQNLRPALRAASARDLTRPWKR